MVSVSVRCVTDLFGAPPLDVPQRDHRALRRRQRGDRPLDHVARLGGEQPLLGEARRRRRPVPGPVVVGAVEAVGSTAGSSASSDENGSDRPSRMPARLGAVREDAEQPRLQRRAPLEAVDALEDGEPGLLRDLLGDRLVSTRTCARRARASRGTSRSARGRRPRRLREAPRRAVASLCIVSTARA